MTQVDQLLQLSRGYVAEGSLHSKPSGKLQRVTDILQPQDRREYDVLIVVVVDDPARIAHDLRTCGLTGRDRSHHGFEVETRSFCERHALRHGGDRPPRRG